MDVLNHIAEDYIPVIASVGSDESGQSYNVNADEAAGAVAAAMRAYKAVFLTDVEGWREDPDDPATKISQISAMEVGQRLESVSGGMRPKLEACVKAIQGGRQLGAHRRRPRSRTRCCSSCSPTRASERRSRRRHDAARQTSKLSSATT